MLLFILTILLLIAFFYDTKQVFIYSLVVYFVFFDMVDGFYKDDKIYAAIRYLVPLGLLLIYTLRFNTLKKSDALFLVLVSYLLLLWVCNTADIIVSSRYLLATLTALLMIPTGKFLAKEVDFLKEFEPYNRFLLISLPAYVVIANIFNFGDSYTDAFTTGFLITSRMYIVPIVVFLAIHYAISNKNRSMLIKANDVVFILVNICILLINTRRTALGMLAGAIIVYAILNRGLIVKMMFLLVIVVIALIFTYPLYEAKLMAQLERRERIQNLETYEEEGRYLESLYIIDYHQTKGSIPELLFGIKLFDTYAFGTRYFGVDRPIHSDINMLFFSTGLVGLFLFAIFILHYFFIGNNIILDKNRKVFYPILIVFLIVILPGRFIGTSTFAPLLMLLLATLKYGTVEDEVEAEEEEDELLIENQEPHFLAKKENSEPFLKWMNT